MIVRDTMTNDIERKSSSREPISFHPNSLQVLHTVENLQRPVGSSQTSPALLLCAMLYGPRKAMSPLSLAKSLPKPDLALCS